MPRPRTAREIAERQVQRAQAAAQNYVDGVEATTRDPMRRAIAQKQKMIQRFNESANDGTWEDGLNAVTIEEWKRLTREKGGPAYPRGVAAALPKTIAFWEDFMPFHQQVMAAIDQLPSETEAQRDFRMTENARLRRAYRRRRSRR